MTAAAAQAAFDWRTQLARAWPQHRPPRRIYVDDPTTIVRFGPFKVVSGSCTSPVQLQLECAFATYDGIVKPQRIFTELWARCRRCANCMKAFMAHWIERSITEMQRGISSRLLTFTFNWRATTDQVYYEMTHFEARVRAAFPERRFKALWAIQRGTNGDHRLHVHMILVQHGDKDGKIIPITSFLGRSRSNPRGQWFGGRADKKQPLPKGSAIQDLANAARYVVRYILRDDAERLPGGRRLSASMGWGKTDTPPIPPNGSQNGLAQWLDETGMLEPSTADEAAEPSTDGEERQPTRPPDRTLGCAIQLREAAFSGRIDRTHDPTPPDYALLARQIGGPEASFRIIDATEWPEEIRKAWGAPPDTPSKHRPEPGQGGAMAPPGATER